MLDKLKKFLSLPCPGVEPWALNLQSIMLANQLQTPVNFNSIDFAAGLIFLSCYSRYSLLEKCWTRDRKVASSNLSRSGWRIFFSRVNFVFWLFFDIRSTPVLLQWHVKDPGHSVKSATGRLHLNMHMHTSLTQQSWNGLTIPLCWHSVGTYQETSSHATRWRTLSHSRLSLLSHCGPILAWRVELMRAT